MMRTGWGNWLIIVRLKTFYATTTENIAATHEAMPVNLIKNRTQSTRGPEKDPRIFSFLALVLWFSVFYPAVPGITLQALPMGSRSGLTLFKAGCLFDGKWFYVGGCWLGIRGGIMMWVI
jgi:hypothetical protein